MTMNRPQLTPANLINNYTKNDRLQYGDLHAFMCPCRPQIVKYLSEVERNVLCPCSEFTWIKKRKQCEHSKRR